MAAVTAAPQWYRWTDAVADAVCAAVADPDRRGERTAPPATLLLLLRQGMPLSRVTAVLEQLLAADEADDSEPTDGARDRPARRRLIAVLRSLDQARGRLDGRQVTLRAAAAVLAGHAGYVAETAALTAAAVDLAAAPADLTEQLLELAATATGRYDAAARAGDRLAGFVTGKTSWSSVSVLPALEVLAARPDPAAGVIAVRLAAAAGAERGWPEPYRRVIATLRRHADPAVAEAALDLDTQPS